MKTSKFLTTIIFYILILSFLSDISGCGGGGSAGGNAKNGTQAISITLSNNNVHCSNNENCIVQITATVPTGSSADSVWLHIIRSDGVAFCLWGPISITSGYLTTIGTFSCGSGGFTNNYNYTVTAGFNYQDSTIYAQSQPITVGSPTVGGNLWVPFLFDYMNYDTSFQTKCINIRQSLEATYNVAALNVSLAPMCSSSYNHWTFTWDLNEYDADHYLEWTASPGGFDPYVNSNIGNNKYYLLLANKFVWLDALGHEHIDYTGEAMNSNYKPGHPNYSIVFVANMDYDVVYALHDVNIVLQSFYNVCANHEMAHQLGNVFDSAAHYFHTPGELFNKCALNFADNIYLHAGSDYVASHFYQLTKIWDFCDKHITNIRNGINGLPNESLELPKGSASPINSEKILKNRLNDIILEAELSKTKVKLFQPIDIKFRYINRGNDNDSQYYLFQDADDYMKFNIIDEKGKSYTKKNTEAPPPSIRSTMPEFIVAPGDTLIETMKVNSFGNYPISNDSEFFGTRGYFPPGKYHGYAYIDQDAHCEKLLDSPVKSNNFEFEVLEPTQEDMEILNLDKQGKDYEIKEKYPSSEYIESVLRWEIMLIKRGIHKGNLTYNDLVDAYTNFFEKFPNSFWNIYYVVNYLNVISDYNAKSVTNNISNLIERYPNTEISKYLSNHNSLEWIKNNIVNHKLSK